MAITDELKNYINENRMTNCAGVETLWGNSVPYDLMEIADRIEVEHEKSMVDALLNDGLPMTDEVMEKHGWMRLPVDVDGKPVRVGDEMVCDEHSPFHVVRGIGDDCFFFYSGDGAYMRLLGVSKEWHHRRVATVEDVLREFAADYLLYKGESSKKIIARYTEKLMLKEED